MPRKPKKPHWDAQRLEDMLSGKEHVPPPKVEAPPLVPSAGLVMSPRSEEKKEPQVAKSKGLVCVSRFAPGLENGVDVAFERGEAVTYLRQNGERAQVIVDSKILFIDGPDEEPIYGYEANVAEGRVFLDERRIVDWPGKAP